jgi:hypothetical protein
MFIQEMEGVGVRREEEEEEKEEEKGGRGAFKLSNC